MNLDTIAYLLRVQAAIGEALTIDQQMFVSKEFLNAEKFLHSDVGKIALQQFISDWQDSIKPKTK